MLRTHNEPGIDAGVVEETICETASCPSAFLEYIWYLLLAYAMLNSAWGVVIPSVGGALMAVLAAACFLSIGVHASRLYAPIAFALCTGISVIAMQFFFYSVRSLENSIGFFGWLFSLIIVQALALRPGFLHRFALAAFAIGLGVLPYIQFQSAGGLMRVRAAETGISNPNSLGMWFGFSTIYFVFCGMQSRRLILRVASWTAALVCLYVVTLTVSRAPLIGIVLACVVGLKSVLKRYFVPLLSLVFLAWLAYESGVFQQAVVSYSARGTVESGRGTVWPLALQRFLTSPWTGVGMEAIPTRRPTGHAITPHNGLLYLGLAAGIVPFMCFLAYLMQAVRGAIRMIWSDRSGDAMILPPLTVFALIEIMNLDTAFMSVWVVVILGLAAAAQGSARFQSTSQLAGYITSPS